MAAPQYGTDLTDIDLAETTTGYSRWGVAGNPGAAPDFATQGTNAIDKQVSNAEGGLWYDNGTGITLGDSDHVWIWQFTATPGITDTIQNRGSTIAVGSSAASTNETSTDSVFYHIGGNDTFGASGRVARCYPVDYTNNNTTSSTPPYRTAYGTPGATVRLIGTGMTTNTAARTNLGQDASRYGKGGIIREGDPTTPATFLGFQSVNDLQANRWGILSGVGGQFELQGQLAIGQDSAGLVDSCYFSDENRTIAIQDTFHSSTNFNRIVIDGGANSECIWNNINITALGTISPGKIEVTSNNIPVSITGGVISNIGQSFFKSNTTITDATFRNCDLITLDSSTMTGTLITQSAGNPSALLTTDPTQISNSEFVARDSDGTKLYHGMEITIPGTYSLSNITFTDYFDSGGSNLTANSGNTNAAVYNNSGGAITLNVTGGNTPSVRNGAGATTVVNNNIEIRLTNILDATEIRILDSKDNTPPYFTPTELAGVEDLTGGVGTDLNNGTAGTLNGRNTFTFSVASGTALYIKAFNKNFIADVIETTPTASGDIQISQRRDRVFSNP